MDPDEARLREFDALRAEVLAHLNLRYTVMSIFYGAAFVIVGKATLDALSAGPSAFVILLGVPFLALFEQTLSLRAFFTVKHLGERLREIEATLDRNVREPFGDEVLGWEARWARVKNRSGAFSWKSVIAAEDILNLVLFYGTLIPGMVGLILLLREQGASREGAGLAAVLLAGALVAFHTRVWSLYGVFPERGAGRVRRARVSRGP